MQTKRNEKSRQFRYERTNDSIGCRIITPLDDRIKLDNKIENLTMATIMYVCMFVCLQVHVISTDSIGKSYD